MHSLVEKVATGSFTSESAQRLAAVPRQADSVSGGPSTITTLADEKGRLPDRAHQGFVLPIFERNPPVGSIAPEPGTARRAMTEPRHPV